MDADQGVSVKRSGVRCSGGCKPTKAGAVCPGPQKAKGPGHLCPRPGLSRKVSSRRAMDRDQLCHHQAPWTWIASESIDGTFLGRIYPEAGGLSSSAQSGDNRQFEDDDEDDEDEDDDQAIP